MKQRVLVFVLILLATALGLFFRLWHIEFGLPHSFYADEPEIAEPAIKYTYDIKKILKEGNYYELAPISYVYGTFPSYLMTFFTMGYSKISNLLGEPATKYDLYVAMRVFNAVLSFLIVPAISFILYKTTKNKKLSLFLYFLLALNWKLIVHAHYINADIILVLLLCLTFLTTLKYLEKENDTKYTVLTGILFGLAVGTKITALISFPLLLWAFYKKGQIKNVAALILIAFGAFSLSNPFSLIFISDFAFRIYQMMFQEAGLVFDSSDTSPFKYISALIYMSTLLIFMISLAGMYFNKKEKFTMFLILNVVFYIIFFSVQGRRVDRWLLPIVPLILYFSALGTEKLTALAGKKNFYPLLGLALLSYVYYPLVLLVQFQRWTPKSEAYLWSKDNLPELSTKLVYTEEGLDPLNKLSEAKVYQYEVYASKNAQLFLPKDPRYYDYVITSSRPMQNYKRPEVVETYPEYSKKWEDFVQLLGDQKSFKLIKKFEINEPNLIPLSNVYIYKTLDKKETPLSGIKPIL